ncbi:MAG: type I glyceraldehyde-3-phosphate dehydrogenase [Nitratiruptor sp.]|nr:type I glyceraldehyde-3-phosphate dehydrogenase [Nitratiruptor sp.]NPA83058.1 type I glyceraldehyde-3-phosphate dehydrogenase [Campylobacterota bacterium]
MVRIGINGFGRIGRALVREAFRRGDVAVVAINDVMDLEMAAYLLRFDSVHGSFPLRVEVEEGGLVVDGCAISYSQQPHPSMIQGPEVDVAIEATGRFTNSADAKGHLSYAKRVIISAPATDETPTFVYGINHHRYAGEPILSNASCTTNCLAPIAQAIHRSFGIAQALMTTVHSYTIDQNLLDAAHPRDIRRARAAAINLVPTTTGAARAIAKVLPELAGRFDGRSVRVPVADVSMMDLTLVLERQGDVEGINQALEAFGREHPEILAIDWDRRVSTDFLGAPFSAIVAADLTQVVGERLVKVMAWYDNEYGYANRVLDMAKFVAKGV